MLLLLPAYAVGLPWHWRVDCLEALWACRASPHPREPRKRGRTAGAPVGEALLIVAVQTALRCRLIGARDLVIDSAPILAWWRRDPDAQVGHAPAHHPRPLLRGYRVHTLLCRGSGLPLLFLLSPESAP